VKRTLTFVAGVAAATTSIFVINSLSAKETKKQTEPTKKPSAAMTAPASHAPLGQLQVELNAFHMRDGAPDEQMEVTHYCAKVEEGMFQCVLFHGQEKDAKLVGIEYVIDQKHLDALPPEERALWHSHAFEVTSGQLTSLGMPAAKEHELMKSLAGTYGKTWHTWQVDKGDMVPIGRPTLMMSFTKDGQIKSALVEQRDKLLGVDTAALKAARTDIKAPMIASGVDKGEQGKSCVPPAAERVPVSGTDKQQNVKGKGKK
jgi:hypothetical protein